MNIREDRLRKLLVLFISSYQGGYDFVELMMPDGWIVQTKGGWDDRDKFEFAWTQAKLEELTTEELIDLSDFVFKYRESDEELDYEARKQANENCIQGITSYLESHGLLPFAGKTREQQAAKKKQREEFYKRRAKSQNRYAKSYNGDSIENDLEDE